MKIILEPKESLIISIDGFDYKISHAPKTSAETWGIPIIKPMGFEVWMDEWETKDGSIFVAPVATNTGHPHST